MFLCNMYDFICVIMSALTITGFILTLYEKPFYALINHNHIHSIDNCGTTFSSFVNYCHSIDFIFIIFC